MVSLAENLSIFTCPRTNPLSAFIILEKRDQFFRVLFFYTFPILGDIISDKIRGSQHEIVQVFEIIVAANDDTSLVYSSIDGKRSF
jgi:hypothetical protein